ncbi:MAG: helix-turn-helix domain-containing protein [Pseudobdellovibrionaceae bacterium]|nr:helix-turn-helix domain-containing protein [Bdellovibrionales bacterium]USN46605.1 MAG: helix-turn-helix domain-containing protein [Pseudobdellovibrionaceae bacterium]
MARPFKVYPRPTTPGPLTSNLLGQYVRARRTQSGLRIDDASSLCGVATETLSRIETAKSIV